MIPTTEQILSALSNVIDPDFKKDLVTLNMIRDVKPSNNQVQFRLVLTTPSCPLKDYLKKSCIDAIHNHIDSTIVVDIIMDAEVTGNKGTVQLLPGVKNIIAVASGKGGVGKSTIAANLAIALGNSGAKVGLLDADIYGPSLPTMFGLTHAKPNVIKEGDKYKILPIEKFGIKLLSIGFLVESSQAVVWRGPMVSSAVKQFLSDCEWGELDYLILDLPPGTGDIHLTLTSLIPISGAVIVTTPQEVALSDVRKAVSMFTLPQINVPLLGIVENMAWFTPIELPNNKYFIFGNGGGKALAEDLGIPILAQIPIIMGIREAGDDGIPAMLKLDGTAKEHLVSMGENIARQMAVRNAGLLPDLSVNDQYHSLN